MKTKRKTIRLTNDMIPAQATHPGQLVADEIEYRGIKQKEVADAMDISPNILSEIIHGKRNITPNIALKLEKTLDIDAVYWMRLQVRYFVDKLKIEHLKQLDKTPLTKRQKAVFSGRLFNYA